MTTIIEATTSDATTDTLWPRYRQHADERNAARKRLREAMEALLAALAIDFPSDLRNWSSRWTKRGPRSVWRGINTTAQVVNSGKPFVDMRRRGQSSSTPRR